MANPIKYSTGSETKALKKGNFFFGTGDVGKGPSDVTGYYQAVDVPQPGYVVYQYLESSASNLTYASLNSDAELINFTNGIANESFTSVAQCFTYYATQNDKVCFNRDYEPIVTDGLVLNVDAGFDVSYPSSGTTWRDLSVSGNNGTLTNSPGFYANGGGGIVFDGVDDYITTNASESINLSEGTICCWCKYDDIGQPNPFNNRVAVSYGGNESDAGFLLQSEATRGLEFATFRGTPVNIGREESLEYVGQWIYQVGTYNSEGDEIYINGVLKNSATRTGNISSSTTFWISREFNRNFYFKGPIGMVQYYNRKLTSDEILQNYNAMKDRFAFIFTVDTTKAGTTSSTQFKLPLVSSGSVNFVVEWGDGTTDTITTYNQAETTHTYSSEGTYEIKIRGILRGWQFNNGGDKLKMGVIKNWGCLDISVNRGFYGCANMTCVATDAPIVSSTSLERFFQLCSNFNGPIGNWDVSNVTAMNEMFAGANLFNQNIGNWNVSQVIQMINMFFPATSFNNGGSDSINNWEMSHRTNFTGIFRGATSFNQPLNLWNTSNAISMDRIFEGASSFNQNIGSWNVSGVTNFLNMFSNASSFNNGGSDDIDNWTFSTTSNISMSGMFGGSSTTNSCKFNRYIGSWNTERVTNMSSMFGYNTSFNQNIGSWNVSGVTNMGSMFLSSASFNNGGSNSINNWNTSNVTNMSSMFNGNFGSYVFNQPIGNWDTSKVTTMNSMFRGSSSFNQPIGNWNTSNVTDMTFMFNRSPFNQYIGDWNTSKVTNMILMFEFATSFNQDISTKIVNEGQENQYTAWDVSNVTSMGRMMRARNFNQPIGNWDMSKVTNIGGMFWDASSFNQPIKDWNITGVTSAANFMTTNGFSTANYDDVLNTWSQKNVKSGLTINFASIKYSSAGAAGRATLVNTYGWTIIDGGQL